MSFSARTYLRLLRVTFFHRQDLPASQCRSLLFCLKFFTLFPLAEFFNVLCLLLDAIFFPGYRRVSIPEPIFLIGNPRSGTTILHRVMAKDEERFFCFRTWEIVFPSVLQKRIVSSIGRLDGLLGNRLRGFLLRAEAKRFKEFNRLHTIGLFLPEEDDKLFVHILASADLAFIFPYGGFERMARLDVAVHPKDQRRVMDFYVQCVRRQAYFKGGRRTFLSKNPWFTGKVENLLRCFPDCKVIYLVRNPLDVVPSAISVARAIIGSTVGAEPEADLDEKVYEAVKFYYSYPLNRLSSLPKERLVLVDYEELIRRPKQVVRQIYNQLRIALTPEYEKRLDQEVVNMQKYRSSHRYSLDQCDVTRERIVCELKQVFDRFGFDTRETSRADCSSRSG